MARTLARSAVACARRAEVATTLTDSVADRRSRALRRRFRCVVYHPSAPEQIERRFEDALQNAEEFFMNESKVQKAMHALARALEQGGVPYAIAGAMAMNAYGYQRVTADVDVLLTPEGLVRARELLIGRGYVEKFPGSRGLRDTIHNVAIDVLVAGEFPGDGQPKPVRFPDPAAVATEGTRVRLVKLPVLVELKLASGMTAPHRLRDLADVIELTRVAGLTEAFANELSPYVRDKYLELWRAAQVRDPE